MCAPLVQRNDSARDLVVDKTTDRHKCFTPLRGGRGSRVVKASDRDWPCHEFEPSTTKDPPCRAVMHVKSVETSSRWCGS
ncbi:hypothetical protein TNCV_4498361 [Trichonephila clavipes]|nr:hypothetical protein TNCV_4498361 [Trichonephila clavipes]